jgi:hypothetical protein
MTHPMTPPPQRSAEPLSPDTPRAVSVTATAAPLARASSPGHLLLCLTLTVVVSWYFIDSFQGLARAAGEEKQEGVASRPQAAEPPALPFLGPPVGGIYAPSEVIFPAQDLPLRFFHDKHVVGMAKMNCTGCHADALTSTNAADTMMPPMEVCLDCHILEDAFDGAFPPSDCTTCHTSYVTDPPVFDEDITQVTADNFREVDNAPALLHIPAPNIKFPHKAHADAKIECAHCHGDMEQVQLATRHNLPTMDLCLDCHTSASDSPPDTCDTCHVTEVDGRLKTAFSLPTAPKSQLSAQPTTGRLSMINFDIPMPMGQDARGGQALLLMPTGRFRPDDHRFDYLEKHRRSASSDEAYCATCHTKAFCTDCHNGVIKPTAIHPPGYAQLHAIDAYGDDTQCSSCHNRQDFCITCHQQVGLSPEKAAFDAADYKYHPTGWVRTQGGDTDTGLQSEHAVAAQRNIGACASCHNESLCISCHSTQTLTISPHPADWTSRCASLFQRNNNACLKCHLISDPLLDLCR